MKSNCILNEGRHFRAEALDLMTLSSGSVKDSLVCGLIVMALKMQNYDNTKGRVKKVISGLQGEGCKAKIPIWEKVLKRFETLSATDLATLSIEDIVTCVNNAVMALALLNPLTHGFERHRLETLFKHYFDQENAAAWPGLFASAQSIAIFIKFMAREDLASAYEQFQQLNANNAELLGLLDRVKRVHSAPIVGEAESNQIMTKGTSAADVEVLITSIRDRCARTRDPKKEFIGEVSAAWMRLIFAKLSIPMAPKNTQIITMAICAQWLERRKSGFSSLIAQVGTGEGKSLIIATLAVYCVKVLKKKVHILENNVSLLEKDYSTFCVSVEKNQVTTPSFFAALQVTTSRHLHEQADVTYCLRENMESFYRDAVFAGNNPFKDTILLADEVDDLIVEKDPNSSYVKEVTNCREPLKSMFDLLHDTRGRGVPTEPYNELLWKEARSAYKSAVSMTEGVHYKAYRGSEIYMIENGEVEKIRYAMWLEYLRYQADKSYEPILKTHFFYQNITHMMTQYDAIVGLSGSLGSASEQAFLRETYNATCFKVPFFLDTCKGVKKQTPLLINNMVEIHPDDFSHAEAIIQLALEKSKTVPVLIITESPLAARILAGKISSRLHGSTYPHSPGDTKVQLLLKFDEHGKHMAWQKIIEKAAEVLSPYRITVTDAFGGRGHDFRVHDEKVEEKGGMALLVTVMPESERDWTQWLGRIARNDRSGQYALILRSSEKLISKNEQALSKHCVAGTCNYNASIITDLLALCDEQALENITAMKSSVRCGQRLNELCDHFYAQYRNDATGEWPGTHENELLSVLLANSTLHTKAGIRAFADSVRLVYVSRYHD